MSKSILQTRHSVRAFEDRPVDVALIREIIADAQLAPSWCNSQPAKAYVLMGDAAKKMVEDHHEKFINNVKSWAEIMPPQPDTWNKATLDNINEFLETIGVAPGREDEYGFEDINYWLFHSPVIVYITIPKNSTAYQAYDAGAFGYGICLSAHEHGIGSIPAYEFVRFPQEVREVFDIPEDEALLMGVGLGYAKEGSHSNSIHERVGRDTLDSVLEIKSE